MKLDEGHVTCLSFSRTSLVKVPGTRELTRAHNTLHTFTHTLKKHVSLSCSRNYDKLTCYSLGLSIPNEKERGSEGEGGKEAERGKEAEGGRETDGQRELTPRPR